MSDDEDLLAITFLLAKIRKTVKRWNLARTQSFGIKYFNSTKYNEQEFQNLYRLTRIQFNFVYRKLEENFPIGGQNNFKEYKSLIYISSLCNLQH